MDISKYIPIIKLLTIIPIIVGVLTFLEAGLPYKKIDTEVISKESKYRHKTDRTTYTINFKGINDQFTEEIYNYLSEGDQVELSATFFHKQIRTLKVKPNDIILKNSTLESYAQYAFGLVFLLSVLAWVKDTFLNNVTSFLFLFIILISSIQLIRMFIF